jgi:hypothetical protein
MFKVWLEWDYGQDHIVFTSEDKAKQWVTALQIEDYEDSSKYLTYDDIYDEGLCSIEELEVI